MTEPSAWAELENLARRTVADPYDEPDEELAKGVLDLLAELQRQRELRDAIAAAVEGWWGRPDPRPTLADAILEALRATLAERPELIEELGFVRLHGRPMHIPIEYPYSVFRSPAQTRSVDQEPSE